MGRHYSAYHKFQVQPMLHIPFPLRVTELGIPHLVFFLQFILIRYTIGLLFHVKITYTYIHLIHVTKSRLHPKCK